MTGRAGTGPGLSENGGMQIDHELLRRVTELEQKLDWLYQQTGHGSPYPQAAAQTAADGQPVSVSAAVLTLAQRGSKVAAIAQYRQETGVDLRDAKNVIDGLV